MRTAITLVVLIFISFICSTTFFFIFPGGGHIPGIVFMLIYILSIAILGDRILLSKMKASQKDTSEYFKKIRDNIRYKFSISKIEIYISKNFSSNVYIFQTMKRRPILVIGAEIKNIISNSESEAMIYFVYYLISKGIVKSRSWLNFLLFFFEWPKIILFNMNFTGNHFFLRLVRFYLFPFQYLRFLFMENNFEKMISRLESDFKEEYLIDLRSLAFKIKNCNANKFVETNDFVDNFSLVPCGQMDFLINLIINKPELSERSL